MGVGVGEPVAVSRGDRSPAGSASPGQPARPGPTPTAIARSSRRLVGRGSVTAGFGAGVTCGFVRRAPAVRATHPPARARPRRGHRPPRRGRVRGGGGSERAGRGRAGGRAAGRDGHGRPPPRPSGSSPSGSTGWCSPAAPCSGRPSGASPRRCSHLRPRPRWSRAAAASVGAADPTPSRRFSARWTGRSPSSAVTGRGIERRSRWPGLASDEAVSCPARSSPPLPGRRRRASRGSAARDTYARQP